MQAPRKIAVAGATGRVGHHIVDVLKAGGHDVVAMSRSGGVDVVTGKGLAEALTGVECIIDAASGPSPDQEAATAFFTAGARNLHEASERAGVRLMVVVTICTDILLMEVRLTEAFESYRYPILLPHWACSAQLKPFDDQ